MHARVSKFTTITHAPLPPPHTGAHREFKRSRTRSLSQKWFFFFVIINYRELIEFVRSQSIPELSVANGTIIINQTMVFTNASDMHMIHMIWIWINCVCVRSGKWRAYPYKYTHGKQSAAITMRIIIIISTNTISICATHGDGKAQHTAYIRSEREQWNAAELLRIVNDLMI